MDCNGIAEGGYQKETGVNINARARNNYSSWCNPKGTGKIPPSTACRARRCSFTTVLREPCRVPGSPW